jgi:RNA 2',3'-cyclic 3'-phosphodiesterase
LENKSVRCFFAIEPDSKSKLAIAHWREKSFPAFSHPVPAANFHLTLVFLGQLTPGQFECLSTRVDELELPSVFTLQLNQLGYWPKPKALWLGAEKTPAAMEDLVLTLTSCAQGCKIPLQKRPYVPHLTLVRKCTDNPPAALIEPAFKLSFEQIHLFESISTVNGVVYQRRHSWSLLPHMAPNSPPIA